MCVCVCVQCLCNNVYMGKTSLSNDCICTFPFQGAHGILISVPYLLCHYTPTIEVYWNGPKSFCVSVRINKKESKVQSQQYDTHAQLKYHFLLISMH